MKFRGPGSSQGIPRIRGALTAEIPRTDDENKGRRGRRLSTFRPDISPRDSLISRHTVGGAKVEAARFQERKLRSRGGDGEMRYWLRICRVLKGSV